MPVILTDSYGIYYGCYDRQMNDWVLVFGAFPSRGTAITHWLPLPMPPDTPMH